MSNPDGASDSHPCNRRCGAKRGTHSNEASALAITAAFALTIAVAAGVGPDRRDRPESGVGSR